MQDGAKTAEQVAAHLGSAPRHTEHLLTACVPIGLLAKEGHQFRNTDMANSFLVEGKSGYMGEWLNLWADWYRPWGVLEETVRTGKPSEEPSDHLGGDADYTRHFILAMHQYARGPGGEIVNHIDLSQRKRLVDIGGGPGTHAARLAQRNPHLLAVVFDLPAVVEIAKEVIHEYGVSDRVTVKAGDYNTDAVGDGDFDVALISNTLHQEDPDVCRRTLRKAYDALEPGGLLIVQAMFLNPAKDGPMWPTIHSLLLSLVYQGGRAYSVDETIEFITQAGFVDARPKRMSLLNADSLILAKKP